MLEEYDFSNGVRGKYSEAYKDTHSETEYLLSSSKNKKRLLSSLAHSRSEKGTQKENTMLQKDNNKVEKINVNIPLQVTELDKWEKGIALALKDKAYLSLALELNKDSEN